ncbi:hypothetical protein J6590_081644 [Homalodisca vitripennis]|nr:hypothetical protein J6590_081644 [Homalodisca vitripennis]
MLLRTKDSSLETAYHFKLRTRPNLGLHPEGSHLSSRSDLVTVPRFGSDHSFWSIPCAKLDLDQQHQWSSPSSIRSQTVYTEIIPSLLKPYTKRLNDGNN